jgi:cytochrome c-type biogenesis protein CcmF
MHTEHTLSPGESVEFDGWTVMYDAPFTRQEPNRTVVGARVDLLRDGGPVTTLEPRINQFDNAAAAVLTPAVHTRFGGDLYLTLRTIPAPEITLSIDTSPMMWTVWLGGLMVGIGGFVAGRGRRRTRRLETAHARS